MTRPRQQVARLCELTQGQHADFFALLAERKLGTTRDGKPFFTCRFKDTHRTVGVAVWADSKLFEDCQKNWREGQCYKIRGAFGESERYGPQIEIEQIRPVKEDDRADGFEPAEFFARSRFEPNRLFIDLWKLAEENIAGEPLRKLVLTILDRHADALKRLPATQRHFYPFAGGWLEHTLNVARNCLLLVHQYGPYYAELKPPLNRDLLIAGAILHDIGRVREFDDSVPPQQTVAGRFAGHLQLGRDLVREAARDIAELNVELLMLLEHVIVSHLALPEWGSPRLPLIPEVLILHHADDLDAKLEMYVRCLTNDAADGLFTDRDPVLNRQLFKGRTV